MKDMLWSLFFKNRTSQFLNSFRILNNRSGLQFMEKRDNTTRIAVSPIASALFLMELGTHGHFVVIGALKCEKASNRFGFEPRSVKGVMGFRFGFESDECKNAVHA